MYIKTYSDLKKLNSFEERFEYLKLDGQVGESTFGFDRYINQKFYKSEEWKSVRNKVIVRDNSCDLGIQSEEIFGKVMVHHMNPININDIKDATEYLLNPNYLITVSMDTHNAIHYGSKNYSDKFKVIERSPNDMSPWRKKIGGNKNE